MEAYRLEIYCQQTDLETLVRTVGNEGAVITSEKVLDEVKLKALTKLIRNQKVPKDQKIESVMNLIEDSKSDKLKVDVKLYRHIVTCLKDHQREIIEKKRQEGYRVINAISNDQNSKLVSIIYVKSLGKFDPSTKSIILSFRDIPSTKSCEELARVNRAKKIANCFKKGSGMSKTRFTSSSSIGSSDEYRREVEQLPILQKSSSENIKTFYAISVEKEVQAFSGWNIQVFCSSSIFRKFNHNGEADKLKEVLELSLLGFKMNQKNWYNQFKETKINFESLIDFCDQLSKVNLQEYYSNQGSRSAEKTIHSVKDQFKLREEHFLEIAKTKKNISDIYRWVCDQKEKHSGKELPRLLEVLWETILSDIELANKELNLLLQEGLDL